MRLPVFLFTSPETLTICFSHIFICLQALPSSFSHHFDNLHYSKPKKTTVLFRSTSTSTITHNFLLTNLVNQRYTQREWKRYQDPHFTFEFSANVLRSSLSLETAPLPSLISLQKSKFLLSLIPFSNSCLFVHVPFAKATILLVVQKSI